MPSIHDGYFSAPVAIAHLTIDPLDVSSPRELSDFFAPLRLYLRPLNDVLTLNIIDQHFVCRKSTLRERPHTAITHMLVQADYWHMLISCLQSGQSVVGIAGVPTAQLLLLLGGAVAALDPWNLSALQLERYWAAAFSDAEWSWMPRTVLPEEGDLDGSSNEKRIYFVVQN